jgi:hypothetical protein
VLRRAAKTAHHRGDERVIVAADIGPVTERLRLVVEIGAPGFQQAYAPPAAGKSARERDACRAGADDAHIAVEDASVVKGSRVEDHPLKPEYAPQYWFA